MEARDISAANFNAYKLQSGDSVIVSKVLNRFTNRITLTGAVYREGIYELDEGMTLRDLINKADGLREDAFMRRAQIFRLSRVILQKKFYHSTLQILLSKKVFY